MTTLATTQHPFSLIHVADDVQLGAFVFLSSLDIVSVASTCRSLRSMFASSAGSGQNAWRLLNPDERAGSISDSEIWLHALAGADRIAELVKRLRHVTIVQDLSFHTPAELQAFASGVDFCQSGSPWAALSGSWGSIFASAWEFDPQTVKAALVANGPVAQSRPLRLCSACGHRRLFLDVRLTLATSACGGTSLAWASSFVGEILQEELDYLELELSGAASCNALAPVLLRTSQTFGGQEALSDRAVLSDDLVSALLQGAPLACSLRVVLRNCGEEQPVVLATSQNEQDSSPRCGSHFSAAIERLAAGRWRSASSVSSESTAASVGDA